MLSLFSRRICFGVARPTASLSVVGRRHLSSGPSLDGKLAVVTGSTSGIGLGIATILASHGADVVINGLGAQAEIDEALDLCRGMSANPDSARIYYHGADLTSETEIADLMSSSAALARSGNVDIIVNNAGEEQEQWQSYSCV
jgi:NAD(P)-dependent dehydrogenase (short-subunit alcohol dehydrogenase family)